MAIRALNSDNTPRPGCTERLGWGDGRGGKRPELTSAVGLVAISGGNLSANSLGNTVTPRRVQYTSFLSPQVKLCSPQF
ncbi:hypothetical protein CC1G_13951 [Coprinopsis cinerea okayama7|uniref:Uncharacterized protein n=1 Tax=Coprinopsis cinerea (strain Okayama-7 / 130 / ATCC MYA-4618 / FGSC 9003) TaxID=240176 RepID=D6RKQ9_COPC7|nr:hypothetical protein CC1G_13951 [Coprinopsis cinerea okayama7\|eukprot:XP_002911911.1 hypothetical protein CC1G_13951 [Coprinopsis cinerea okayama7\